LPIPDTVRKGCEKTIRDNVVLNFLGWGILLD
jgi:hypothetical protein